MKLVDGMTAYNTNVQEAVDRCLEIVDHESKITIDVMICDFTDDISEWNSSGNSWQNYWRVQDIRNRFRSFNSSAAVMRAHPKIFWRHVVNQSERGEGK